MNEDFDELEFLRGGSGDGQQRTALEAKGGSGYEHLQVGTQPYGPVDYKHMQNMSAYGDRGAIGGGGGQAAGSGDGGNGNAGIGAPTAGAGGGGGDDGGNGQDTMGKAVLSLAEQLSELHRSTRYATGLANLKVLRGNEGSEGVRRYFRELELLTKGWSEGERMDALSVKMEGKAQVVYASMPVHLQSVYAAVKAELIERLANDESKRMGRMTDLFVGKLRSPSESISDFGDRVWKMVQDSCEPSTPPKQVDEMAKSYFMIWVNDAELLPSLTERQDRLEFRHWVDHAATLRANLDRIKQLSANKVVVPSSIPNRAQQIVLNGGPSGTYVQQNNAPASNQPPKPAQPLSSVGQRQQRFNPNRMDLRYQSSGFPPARGNFQAQPAGNQRPSNAAVDAAPVISADGSAVQSPSGSEHSPAPITATESPNEWWGADQTPYNEPLADTASRGRRRGRRRSRVRFQEGPTNATITVSDIGGTKAKNNKPMSEVSGSIEVGKAEEVSSTHWQNLPATSASMTSLSAAPALGIVCNAIVRIKGMPCEALLDTGSRVSIVEGAYLRGIIQKSGGDPRSLPVRTPSVTNIVCGNRSSLGPVAAISMEISYGSSAALVELQITKDPMAFPLILGTNCLTDLGFELINKSTGEELLSVDVDSSVDASDKALLPVITACANVSLVVHPYQQMRLSLAARHLAGPQLFAPKLANSERGAPCLADVVDGQVDVWITNDAATPMIIEQGQEVGTLEGVVETYSSSDMLSTDILEELTKLASEVAGTATVTSLGIPTDEPPKSLSPEQRLQEILRLLGPAEVPLSEAQQAEFEAVLLEFNDVFALNDSELGRTSLVRHRIELVDRTPVRIPPRPIPYALRESVAKMVQDYYEREVIRPSTSSYSSPIVIARKKDGSLRFCTDYRVLNSRTKKFAMPLPNIDYLLLTMGPKQYFSSLDLLGAYWQMELDEDSKQYTAFPALNRLWEFNVLSFGLTNAPGTFQEFMQRLLDGILNDYAYVFLDDILIVSSTWEEHLSHLREVFTRLRSAGLRLKPKKCRIAVREVHYLGHVLSPEGLKMDPEKVAAVNDFPRPTCVRDVQSFHGLANHYRKFIQNFALIAHPLYRLTKKGEVFSWGDKEENSFIELKRVICEQVTLQFPNFEVAKNDPSRPLTLQTDACRDGIAGVLCQKDERGALQPIHFVSRSTKGAELRYGITELEALSVKYCFNKLAPYLIGLNVRVETDHSALVPMFTNVRECGNARIDKWAMQLMSRFDFYVVYRPGKSNAAADALSRSVKAHGEVVVAVMTRRMVREAARQQLSENDELAETNEQQMASAEPAVPREFLEPDQEPEDGPTLPEEGGQSWDEALMSSELADVVNFLSARELPKDPGRLHELLKKAESFALRDGKLHFVDPESGELRLMVPEPFRRKLFRERHSGLFAGHACGSKIYKMLKGRFWWPGMRTDCEKFAKACQVCVHTRKPRLNVPPLQPIVSSAPWELLCMDLLQLPQSFEGYKYALICIDHFSKYAIVHPVPNKTAEAVASVLMKEVFLIYGPCRRIHSDLGGEFCNRVVAQLRDVFGMGQTTTAGYNPRCNGVAERMGRQLIKMLTQTLPIPQGWVERLPFVLFAHNVSPHEETGESPFFLLFARDVNFPTEIDQALLPTPYSVDIDDFRVIMMQNIGSAVENVQRALQKSRERAKKYYDERHQVNPNKYQVGQRVMVFDPSIGTAAAKKLHWRFFGPFRIAEISDNNAKVYPIDKPHAEPQLVPLDRLSPVPAEVPNFSYARRPDIAQIVSTCVLADMPFKPSLSEIDEGFELMSTPTTVTEHIMLRKAEGDSPKRTFESAEKRVLLVRLVDECGLGPYWPCSGTCTDRCRPILVRNALPMLQGKEEAELKVPTLAHAVYIGQLKRYADDSEQAALVRKILDKDASVLNREFYGLFDGTDVEPPSFDELLAQAHLRKERCYRARRALELNPWVPIKCFGDNAKDHRDFTSALFSSSTISHPMIGADKLGPVWERVRYSGGRKVVSGPFLALCPPGDESLFASGIIKIVSVKDLRGTNCELRDAIYDGSVQAIAIGLPPPSKEDPERLQAIINVLDFGGFDHIQVFFVPPPPSCHTSYGAVLEQLARLPGLSLVKATDSGRSLLEAGRIGNGFDKRVVEKEGPRQGHWTHFGRELVRSYIVDVAGVEWMRRSPVPPPPRPSVPVLPATQHRLASVVRAVPQGSPHSFRPAGGNFGRRRPADASDDNERGHGQHRDYGNYGGDKRRRD